MPFSLELGLGRLAGVPCSCLTLFEFSRSTWAASTCACSALVVSLSMVDAMSPFNWRSMTARSCNPQVTSGSRQPTESSRTNLEDDAVLERGAVQIVHGAGSKGIEEGRVKVCTVIQRILWVDAAARSARMSADPAMWYQESLELSVA